ncbi:MAG TPA: hemerythrin domain-containing protein [Candidatus Acidoferrales bacterium]
MSSLTPTFHARAERIHREHEVIEQTLADLELNLERMTTHPENGEPAGMVCRSGRELAKVLPPHCKREEEDLHDVVADVSPQLQEFTRLMKEQHQTLMARLNEFVAVLQTFESNPGAPGGREMLIQEGKSLVRDIRRHVATEETELKGFL